VDFDQLHTFLEIVRLKSFSKAAQTCFRTQPAISAQIRQMEQELGTQLFERFGSRITLTTAGKIFSDYAQQILETRRQAFDSVRELDRVPRGEVVIAANEATCVNVLPRVFSTFKERFPEVQLQVMRSYGSQTVQSVMDNSVDFGITQLPVQERRLQVVQIYSDEIRLLTPASHPLAQAASVGPEQIARYALLLPKSGRTRSRIDEYLASVEDDLNVSMELESSEMIKQFIMAGLGIGFMGVSNVQLEIRRKSLCAIALAPLPMVRNLGMIYRKDKPLSRAALGFIDVMAEFARRSQSDGPLKELEFVQKSAPKAS
jgi:DNA-binding transcriptional LysR family regulator